MTPGWSALLTWRGAEVLLMMWRFRQGDSGAAALEFALVVPLLLVMMFAIVDYGIYFSDGLASRSAVQAATRQGVVNGCVDLKCIADLVQSETDPVGGGDIYVNVSVVTVPGNDPGWRRGNDLLVCSIVKVGGLSGLPQILLGPVEMFPDGGTTRAKTKMRIEQVGNPHPNAVSLKQPLDLPSALGDWGFCT